MRFCILINPTDHWQQAVEHGFNLAKQTYINQELVGVFFYGSSVHIVQETRHQARWQDFSDCPLYLCRTMINEYQIPENIIAPHFQIIGMAPWVAIMEQSDRIVEII